MSPIVWPDGHIPAPSGLLAPDTSKETATLNLSRSHHRYTYNLLGGGQGRGGVGHLKWKAKFDAAEDALDAHLVMAAARLMKRL